MSYREKQQKNSSDSIKHRCFHSCLQRSRQRSPLSCRVGANCTTTNFLAIFTRSWSVWKRWPASAGGQASPNIEFNVCAVGSRRSPSLHILTQRRNVHQTQSILEVNPQRGGILEHRNLGKTWTAGFRTRPRVHGNVLRLWAGGREGISSSPSPVFRARRQLPGYGRSLRSLQKRGIAGTFLARSSSRQR